MFTPCCSTRRATWRHPVKVLSDTLKPNWPGVELYPPQPMVDQTRAVLEKYAAAGGRYREVVIEDAGHMPYIEKPAQFNAVFHDHIETTSSPQGR